MVNATRMLPIPPSSWEPEKIHMNKLIEKVSLRYSEDTFEKYYHEDSQGLMTVFDGTTIMMEEPSNTHQTTEVLDTHRFDPEITMDEPMTTRGLEVTAELQPLPTNVSLVIIKKSE